MARFREADFTGLDPSSKDRRSLLWHVAVLYSPAQCTTGGLYGFQRRIDHSKPRPYRFGYFQGGVLISVSLLMLLGAAKELKWHKERWPILALVILAGMIGVPLGVGLLMKKKFALALVYVMLGLAIVQT